MSWVFLTFLFPLRNKKLVLISFLLRWKQILKKYQGVIRKVGIYFLTHYIWLSWVPDLHKQAEGNGQNGLTCDGGVMEGSPARKQYVCAMWSRSTMS